MEIGGGTRVFVILPICLPACGQRFGEQKTLTLGAAEAFEYGYLGGFLDALGNHVKAEAAEMAQQFACFFLIAGAQGEHRGARRRDAAQWPEDGNTLRLRVPEI